MRLPPASAHDSQRARFGQYVSRRLRRAKRVSLADEATTATNALITLYRAVEDCDGAIQEGIADRDAIDDELDDVAQTGRAALAGRGINAIQEAPYTLIFPQGIGYYIAATLDQEIPRYGELKQRMEEHLAPDDAVRKAAVPAITTGLAAFPIAVSALEKARTDKSLAGTRRDAAVDEWERLMVKIYGLLVAEVGRAAADRFFPKLAKQKKNKGEGGEGSGG